MAGTVPTITQGSIVVERAVPRKPIFFVRVGNQSLVIKGEGGGSSSQERAISIKWTSKLMKNVNNRLVNTKVLNLAEVALFKQAALLKFADPKSDERYWLAKDSLVWVKMPVVAGLSDSDFHGEDRRPVRSKIKKLIVKFHDEAIWAPLGKIVAVDIFNGNNDRFDSVDGTWVNYGNVMFLDDGDTNVIGLDTFDPASGLALGNPQTNPNKLDRLRALSEPEKRLAFAKASTGSVGEVLARNLQGLQKLSIKIANPYGGGEETIIWELTVEELKSLYLPFAPLFAAGIEKGANELKTYLQDKVRQYRREQPVERVRGGIAPPVNVVPMQRPRGGVQAIQPNPPGKPAKLPQGVWDQMGFLGWQV